MFLQQGYNTFALNAKLTGAAASSQLTISVTYTASNTQTYGENQANFPQPDTIQTTNNTNSVLLLAEPSIYIVNTIEFIKIYNPDTQANTVQILADLDPIYSCTVNPGETIIISETGASNMNEQQDLSNLVPKTTTVNGHALSSNVTVSATDVGAPTISNGNGVPSSIPAKIGDVYVDTTNYKTYIAKGASSSSDWIKQNGSYSLQATSGTEITPANGNNYYFGQGIYWASGGGARRIYITKPGKITSAYGMFYQTAGSSEISNLYLRINNTNDYLVSNSIVNNASVTTFSNTSLGITVNAGDYIEFHWACPTWATNPTNLIAYASIGIDL